MVSQRRVVCLVCGACLAIFAIAPNYIHPNGVRITLLPVGQGDSTVFELPSGHVLLVDGGGNYDASFDPGRRVIEPFLRRRSIKRIDIMVVTHPHLDHLLGLLQVANEFEIGEIWHSGFSNQDPLLAQLLDVADKRHIIVKQGHEIWGTHLFGGVNVDVLAPRPPSGDIFTTWSTNNNSLVFRMSYQQDSALWPGDAEQEAEVELLAHHANLKSTIVKAGHHGSRTSSSPEWVSATNPEHVIFCTQQGNQWGFPHPEIVARWKQQGTKTWDTGTNGELTFWMTGNGVKAESFR